MLVPFAYSVCAPACLNDSGRIVSAHILHILIPIPCQLTLHRRLYLHQAVPNALDIPSGLEAAEDALNINDEILLCMHEHEIGVPARRWIYLQQVLDDQLEPGMSCEPRIIDPSIDHFSSEDLFVVNVEGVLAGDDLVHRNAERPHVSLGRQFLGLGSD